MLGFTYAFFVSISLWIMVHLLPGVKLSLELKAQFSARGAVLYPIVFKLEVGETKQTKYHLAVVVSTQNYLI